MSGLRIGSVPYLNALPLTEGIERLELAVPAKLTERFHAGHLDVALLPSFAGLAGDYAIVPGAAVASPGPVDSVLLFHRAPLREVEGVLLDESSRTSAALTRVLFAEYLGRQPEYRLCQPTIDPRAVESDQAVLLIGDPAMVAPRDGLEVTDLALLWREGTSLPFVFALWIARDETVAKAAAPLVLAAKERGLARRGAIAREAALAMGLPEEQLLIYLMERITFDFGSKEQDAYRLYGELCRRHGLLNEESETKG